jgi:acetyl esterase
MKNFKNFERLDSDMQKVVEQLLAFNAPPIESLDVNAARNNPTFKNAVEELSSHSALVRTMNVASPVLPEKVAKVTHIIIPGRDGELNARAFYPTEDAADLPIIVYFHGGGWVIADLNVYESSCRALCNAAESIVISVAYRQSPEAKFPAAVHDAYDALQYVLENAADLGGDPDRVAVAGESAGGNLAAVSCLMAKENGGKLPAVQLLIYPVTDTSMSQPSYAENIDTQPLHTAMMPWFWENYLAEDADESDPHIAPLLATDLSSLPPAIVITAEFDPLRDEGEAYAAKLQEHGVPVTLKRFDGVVHEFFGLAGAVGKAKEAVKFAAIHLKDAFALETSQ